VAHERLDPQRRFGAPRRVNNWRPMRHRRPGLVTENASIFRRHGARNASIIDES
jgi:hypothetical protein